MRSALVYIRCWTRGQGKPNRMRITRVSRQSDLLRAIFSYRGRCSQKRKGENKI